MPILLRGSGILSLGIRALIRRREKACTKICQKNTRGPSLPEGPPTVALTAQINGAYVPGPALWQRDPDRTITIAMRGGLDSDCNPSSAGGVLLHHDGFASLPERSSGNGLDEHLSTPLQLPAAHRGMRKARPRRRCQMRRPGGEAGRRGVLPLAGERAGTKQAGAELGARADRQQPLHAPRRWRQIKVGNVPAHMREAVAKFAPAGDHQLRDRHGPGLRADWGARKNVLVTHPLDEQTGCVLSKKIKVASGQKARLRLLVAHDPQGTLISLFGRREGTVAPSGQQSYRLRRSVAGPRSDLSGFAAKRPPRSRSSTSLLAGPTKQPIGRRLAM